MKKFILIMLLLLAATSFIASCANKENDAKISDQKQASEAVADVGKDVESLEITIKDIDSDLG